MGYKPFIKKSSRHQKIIGNFGEYLICNWLSRSGFEVSIVDHTGIDIIVYNPQTKDRLGISVKSRTRNIGKETTHVNLFNPKDRQLWLDACEAFGCEPWLAIYVETASFEDVFLTSLKNYDANYSRELKIQSWKMSPKHLEAYEKDENLTHLHIKFEPKNWFKR